MEINTSRLILREFRQSDLGSVHLYASDRDTTEYMDWGPNDEAETKTFIDTMLEAQNQASRRNYVFGITTKGSDIVTGSIGIDIQSLINRSASFGYILRKDKWGQGIVTEAAQAVLNFGFSELNLHRIWATCRPENAKSIHILKKLGFEKEGHLRDDKFIRGAFRDSILFAKLCG